MFALIIDTHSFNNFHIDTRIIDIDLFNNDEPLLRLPKTPRHQPRKKQYPILLFISLVIHFLMIVFITYFANRNLVDYEASNISESTEVKSYLFIRPKVRPKALVNDVNEAVDAQTNENTALSKATQHPSKIVIERQAEALVKQTIPEKQEQSTLNVGSKSIILSSQKDLVEQSNTKIKQNFAERSMTGYFQEHNQYKEDEISKAAVQEYRKRQTSSIINTKRTIDSSPTSAINVDLVDEKLVASKLKNVNCESGFNKVLVVLAGSTGGAVRCTPAPDIQSFIDKHKNKN